MRCRYIIPCTFAEYVNARLNLIGGDIDKVFLPEIPGLFPSLVVASRIALDRDEVGRAYAFSTCIVDPDGEIISEGPTGTFETPEMAPEHTVSHVSMVIQFVGIVFKKEGWHRVVLTVDGTELGDAPFKVVPLNKTLHLQEDARPAWKEIAAEESGSGQSQ